MRTEQQVQCELAEVRGKLIALEKELKKIQDQPKLKHGDWVISNGQKYVWLQDSFGVFHMASKRYLRLDNSDKGYMNEDARNVCGNIFTN
jgi:hypothetical protein